MTPRDVQFIATSATFPNVAQETLQEFAEEWWQLYAAPNLAPTTLASYASLWDAHVLPRLGATTPCSQRAITVRSLPLFAASSCWLRLARSRASRSNAALLTVSARTAPV